MDIIFHPHTSDGCSRVCRVPINILLSPTAIYMKCGVGIFVCAIKF